MYVCCIDSGHFRLRGLVLAGLHGTGLHPGHLGGSIVAADVQIVLAAICVHAIAKVQWQCLIVDLRGGTDGLTPIAALSQPLLHTVRLDLELLLKLLLGLFLCVHLGLHLLLLRLNRLFLLIFLIRESHLEVMSHLFPLNDI